MKKLITFIAVVVLFTMNVESFAQTFGVRAGLNLTNMLAKDDDETYSDDYKTKVGFQIGGTAEFEITEMFSFETGLFLSNKGFRINKEGTEYGEPYKFKSTWNLYYIEIPLTAKATFDLGNQRIYGIFGPSIGIGLSGKDKAKTTYMGESDTNTETVDWGTGEDNDLKRFDFGWIIGAGVEYQAFSAGLSYNLGLANIAATTDGGYKVKNRVFAITVGYRFGQK
ncbi:MAG: porin family protein [Bacteroidales bacterium]|nr:porin family protein [Bacteroidales bacterium]